MADGEKEFNTMKAAVHFLKQVFKRIYLVYALLAFMLSFLLFFPFFLFGVLTKNHRIGLHLNRHLCSLYCFLIGIRIVVENKHLLDKEMNYIFCPNHFSFLDILSMPHLPVSFKFVGKLSLSAIPLFGYYYKHYHILVDRESRRSSYLAYQQSIEALNAGYSLTVFPEGGINVVGNVTMSAFKSGPFKMACETGVPVVPVSILDNWAILQDDGKFNLSWRRRSRLVIHEPIDPSKHDTLESFQSKVQEVIQQELNSRNAS